MDKPMPDSHFKTLCFMYKFRDFFIPRRGILEETSIRSGFHVLDFGCGPGSYTVVAAGMVGPTGKVHALDIHPLAIQRVQKLSAKKGLTNIHTIQSDCATGLENESMDLVLLCDILHHLSEAEAVLRELHRVLKATGTLSCNDHHMKEEKIVSRITSGGLFKLARKGNRIHNFTKSKGGKA
jgi:ubiquinone/menaquinone biosynthesis C-methylase UbiE